MSADPSLRAVMGTIASHRMPQKHCPTRQSFIRLLAHATTILTSNLRTEIYSHSSTEAPDHPGWGQQGVPKSPLSLLCPAHALATQTTNAHRPGNSRVTQYPEEQKNLESSLLETLLKMTSYPLPQLHYFLFTAFYSSS